MDIFINNAVKHYLGTHYLEADFVSCYGETTWGDVFKGNMEQPVLHETIRYGLRLKLSDVRRSLFNQQGTVKQTVVFYAEVELLRKMSYLARLHEVQNSYCTSCHHSQTRSRHTLLKFSRSLYLDNLLSESIHTWTIGTLWGWLSFHDIRPQGPCQS